MKTLFCRIRGHQYYNKNTKNLLYKEIGCKNCNQEFTTDGYGRIVKLTSFWKSNHSSIKKHFHKI